MEYIEKSKKKLVIKAILLARSQMTTYDVEGYLGSRHVQYFLIVTKSMTKLFAFP